MKNKKLCPICGEGHLVSNSAIETRELNGFSGNIHIHYSTCDECGCDTATDEDMKLNVRAMNAFKKKSLGLLSGSEISEIRKKLGISQKEAAVIFGGGPNSFTKYEKNDVIQSVSMDKIIRLAFENKGSFDILCKNAGVKKKQEKTFSEILVASIETNTVFSHPSTGWVSICSSSGQGSFFAKTEYH